MGRWAVVAQDTRATQLLPGWLGQQQQRAGVRSPWRVCMAHQPQRTRECPGRQRRQVMLTAQACNRTPTQGRQQTSGWVQWRRERMRLKVCSAYTMSPARMYWRGVLTHLGNAKPRVVAGKQVTGGWRWWCCRMAVVLAVARTRRGPRRASA